MEDKEVIAIQYRKISELEEENKNLKEEVKKWKMVADENGTHYDMLEEENKKLKKYYDRDKEELMESCYSLAKENDELNIKVASLEWEIKWLNSVIDKLREELSAYDREYFDEDKKAKNIFMEEDTLQELRDIGEI